MRTTYWLGTLAAASAILVISGCGDKATETGEATTTPGTTATTGTSPATTTTTTPGAPGAGSGPAAQIQQKANDPNTSAAGRQYLQGR